MISTSQLSFAYPGQKEFVFPDITCMQNEHALILGPSGAGKTTLLHLLGGILNPTKGQIVIRNTPVHQFKGRKLDDFRGRYIGIIFQRPHFIRSLTALENLLLSQRLGGHKTDKKNAIHLLQKLSIDHKAGARTDSMSVGEQQRLAIARALINKPEIILADEPSSALDDQNCFQMVSLLLDSANENKSNLLIVTHDSRIKNMIDKKFYLDNSIYLKTTPAN